MELKGEGLKTKLLCPEGLGLRQWTSKIAAPDALGCDSVGQHLVHAVDTETTVVVGSASSNIYSTDKKD